jgi:hypothetical protein
MLIKWEARRRRELEEIITCAAIEELLCDGLDEHALDIAIRQSTISQAHKGEAPQVIDGQPTSHPRRVNSQRNLADTRDKGHG